MRINHPSPGNLVTLCYLPLITLPSFPVPTLQEIITRPVNATSRLTFSVSAFLIILYCTTLYSTILYFPTCSFLKPTYLPTYYNLRGKCKTSPFEIFSSGNWNFAKLPCTRCTSQCTSRGDETGSDYLVHKNKKCAVKNFRSHISYRVTTGRGRLMVLDSFWILR